MRRKILVIDIGGSNVKLMISRSGKRKFKSGPHLTPREMVAQIEPLVSDWKFDAISIGFPSPVRDGRILSEPKHLGKGWVEFDFEKAFGNKSASSTTRRCRRLAAIVAAACSFSGSAPGLDQLWCGTITFCRWNWEISLIATAASLKIILASQAWRGSVRKPGGATSSMRWCS